MKNKEKLNDLAIYRIYELRLRTMVYRLLKRNNNNLYKVFKYIESLSFILDFDYEILIKAIKEIIDMRYAPTINEIIKINYLSGVKIKEIADILNMKESTIKMHIYRNKYNISGIVLYPRLQRQQLEQIKIFFEQYYTIYIPMDKVIV